MRKFVKPELILLLAVFLGVLQLSTVEANLSVNMSRISVDDTVIYEKAYSSNKSGWSQFNLTGSKKSGSWLLKSANATLPKETDKIAVFSCTWSNEWNCHGGWQINDLNTTTDDTSVSVNGSLWSEPDTWPNGNVPDEGDIVNISENMDVVLDKSTPALKGIHIDGGNLTFAQQNLSLTAGYVLVKNDGWFKIGTEDQPFQHQAMITLGEGQSAPSTGYEFCGLAHLCSRSGNIELHSTRDRPKRAQLQATSETGDTEITVAEDVNWDVSDEIILPGSSYTAGLPERRQITAVNGRKLSLNESLEYRHLGEMQYYGSDTRYQVEDQVGVLHVSGNIVIQGQYAELGNGSVYWVDAENGDDANPGTKSRPFATISRTTANGFLEPGDTVIVREGIYREAIRPQEDGAVEDGNVRRITWAAYPGEDVVVSGADLATTSWQRQNDDTWRSDWVWESLFRDVGATGIDRRELFIDEGEPLIQVANRSEVVPGTFYVEGGDGSTAPNAVYLRTHDDTDPNPHTIEVGQRHQLFQTAGELDYQCGSSGRYYHLVGLTFRHAASHSQRGAVCPGAEGTVIESVTARENNGAGFKVIGNKHVLRDVRALRNGRTGLSGASAKRILVDGAEMAHNNYRGHSYFVESGGGKFVYTNDSTFGRLHSHHNEGPGFWLDIRNQNNTVARSVFDRNVGMGLNLELKTRETRVVNNVFSRTSYEQVPHRGFGLSMQLSYDNLAAHNTFILNEGGGIITWNDGRASDPAYKPTRSKRNDIYNNLFVNNLQGESPEMRQLDLVDLKEGEDTHTEFTNRVDGNAYWPANGEKGFGALYHVRHPDGGTNNFKASSLSEWQNVTIHDRRSLTVNISEQHVIDPTDYESGWRLVNGSQLADRAVELPEEWESVVKDFDGAPRKDSADVGADELE